MRKNVVPMLHVPDVRRTVDWYRDLGFDVTVTYGDNAGGLSCAMVSFGAGEVMFSSGGRLSSRIVARSTCTRTPTTSTTSTIASRIESRLSRVRTTCSTACAKSLPAT
jgi:hypothetical protein